MVFPDTKFIGGRAIHNKDINRIQLLFDGKPSDEIRNELKRNGFHWSRAEGAWQRQFNHNTIKITNILIKNICNKELTDESEEEFE